MSLSPRYPTYTDAEIIEWIVKLYRKGRTLDYISAKSGIDKYKVRRLLLKDGVQLRRRGRAITSDTELRRCKDCGTEQPLTAFSRDIKHHLGRGYRCKSCDNLRRTKVSFDE